VEIKNWYVLTPADWLRLLAGMVAIAIMLSGCGVAQYTASTEASYETPSVKGSYKSNKNQEGFKADMEIQPDGKITKLHIETTATTPEAAIAAAMAVNLKLLSILEKLTPLIEKAALGAGS